MPRDLHPLPPVGRTVVAGFESTLLPAYDVDLLETTGHARQWRADLAAVTAAGARQLRYPLRWHRIEAQPGVFDWAETDEILDHFGEHGIVAIVDLVHHTSYPGWLTDGFRDARFGAAYLRFAEAVAVRYPQIAAYTLFNEPFATLFLAGHESLWPPYDRGVDGFVRLTGQVLPAVSAAARCWAELLPQAHHVWVDTAEHHRGDAANAAYVALANDRRHACLDLLLNHDLDPARPFLRALLEHGGEALFELAPVRVDVLGLDYYCHSEWYYDAAGARAPSPQPLGFAAIAEQYWHRYGLPLMLTETNLRGLPTDRITWLRYTLEQYESALARGVPLHGYCWFPQVDSCDWDSLLARSAGRIDPVGVVTVAPDGSRQRTALTEAWEDAVAGKAVADLPAYRLQSPCDEQLSAITEDLTHWPWQSPPVTATEPAQLISAPDHLLEAKDPSC